MNRAFQTHLQQQLAEIRQAGTCKNERVIMTPQGTTIRVAVGKPVLNLCANNYLGLAQHPYEYPGRIFSRTASPTEL